MRQRLEQPWPGLAVPEITVTTFHGLGLHILRQNHAARPGSTPDFGVADEAARSRVAAELAGSAAAGPPDARAPRPVTRTPGRGRDGPGGRGLVDFDRLVELPTALLARDPALAVGAAPALAEHQR